MTKDNQHAGHIPDDCRICTDLRSASHTARQAAVGEIIDNAALREFEKDLSRGLIGPGWIGTEFVKFGGPDPLEPREIRITDPKTGGQKGQKQEAYEQIPVWPLAQVAKVYRYGEGKYARANFLKGYNWSLSQDALFRHINAWRSGESYDPESGIHHLAHAMFHLLALMQFEHSGLGTDDRMFKEKKEKEKSIDPECSGLE